MKSGFAIILIFTIIFGGGYWFYTAEAVCNAPLAYRIGSIDPNFDLSFDEARRVVSDAESVWEDATCRNLFTYDATADFSINFIFDDRQALFNAEQDLQGELEEREEMSDDVREEYESLLAQYNVLKEKYEVQADAYEDRLHAHNAEVERWNTTGGAPEDVFQDLSERQNALSREQQELNTIARQLNTLVQEINKIGDEGNVLVSTYNNIVEVYNNRFNQEREFTQGDYQGDTINIYQYADFDELRLVMAHELGHSLSLDHVAGEESIMYHFMGGQDPNTGLTTQDVDEFKRVCGEDSFTLWSIL